MVGLNATNLGDQAQTKRLITQDISALNYQQPFLQSGTIASPVALALNANIAYTAGFNKYVLYMAGPATNIGVLSILTVTGTPIGLSASSTISASCEYILSGLTPTFTAGQPLGIYDVSINVLDDTNGVGIIQAQMSSLATNPQFTSGSPILKIVIYINLD